MLNFLYVYKVATFGGVERVLLNRAEVFKSCGIECRFSLFFLEDKGALTGIRRYVASKGLETHVQFADGIGADNYDYVVSIDTPEVLQKKIPRDKILFECHTTYHESRRYLGDLPDWIRFVLVPSPAAKSEIAERYPMLREKLHLIRNCIPGNFAANATGGPFWRKQPLLYLGRMDGHKNVREVLDVFRCYRDTYGDDLFLLLVGPVEKDVDLDCEIRQRCLFDRVLLLPPVTFDKVSDILALVKKHRGIFISSSKGESFGLSAAEAMYAGIPVLLSGIPAHVELVRHNMQHVYPLGETVEAARKLRGICAAYEDASHVAGVLGQQFSQEHFLSDWQSFLDRLHP